MASLRIDRLAALLLLAQACSSDYGLHTMNCGSDAFDSLDDCKEAMVAMGYVATLADADAYASSCCELTTDHHESGAESECFPLKEQSDCMGDTDPNAKADAGGADSSTIGVIAGNLTAVGATLASAESLDSGKQEAATEEVTSAMAEGTAEAATAAKADPASKRAAESGARSESEGGGADAASGFQAAGSSSGTLGSKAAGLSGGLDDSGGEASLAERIAAALGLSNSKSGTSNSSAIARLKGRVRPGGSGGSNGTPDLSAREAAVLDYRAADAGEESPQAFDDPEDYFSRSSQDEDLFLRVQRKLDEKERLWMIQGNPR